ncbi:hypothetical protein M1589_04765 [Candidatus Marsarchaeota archaeon]|jgi:hypothetical protein|nr:hypothetical protein [Candidatus Marsarchaeota archaeon]MCL5115423.1 hypothetical protein [Candidatus Marsarchaeota archaeon]
MPKEIIGLGKPKTPDELKDEIKKSVSFAESNVKTKEWGWAAFGYANAVKYCSKLGKPFKPELKVYLEKAMTYGEKEIEGDIKENNYSAAARGYNRLSSLNEEYGNKDLAYRYLALAEESYVKAADYEAAANIAVSLNRMEEARALFKCAYYKLAYEIAYGKIHKQRGPDLLPLRGLTRQGRMERLKMAFQKLFGEKIDG